MKTRFAIIFYLCLPFGGATQSSKSDSLKRLLINATDDSSRHNICNALYYFYVESEMDSALVYVEQRLQVAQKNKKHLNRAADLTDKGLVLRHMGRYSESLQCYLEAFEIARNPKNEKHFWQLPPGIFGAGHSPANTRLTILGNLHMQMANLFIRTGNSDLSIAHFAEAEKIGKEAQSHYFLYYLYATMGIAYKNLNKLDSAILIVQNGLSLSKQYGYKENVSRLFAYIGEIQFERRNIDTAIGYYHRALQLANEENNFVSLVMTHFGLAKSFIAQQEKDSGLYYARKAIETLNRVGSLAGTVWNPATAYENLFRIYKMRNETDSAEKYMELALRAKDSLYAYAVRNSAQAQGLFLQEQIRLKELEKEKIQFRNRVRTYSMLAGIVILLLLAIIFYRNNRQKQKAKTRIEKAYDELKATQAQLIQQEKMASLGELTAGIAHEIQNPLNFVNNFSEVSNELIEEMRNEMAKGNHEDAKAIVDDVQQNLEKINHHGKRADAIVKSMLQHSGSSSGKKEPTDINLLTDEFLRLAYHGLRAKDKSFHATIKTDFDQSIGKINIIPQDIGRVLVNLINNAFYAESERKNQTVDGYEPTLTVTTTKIPPSGGGGAEIRVKDNGSGIPLKIRDKIFQPFFTTKPTGQGTGLGLSLSYDIVKAHGGELKVETKEGEGSEFIIQLPFSKTSES